MEVNDDFIGKGFAFPMGVDSRGGILMSRSVADIEEALTLILSTAPGERRMRPEFGCNLHSLVFSPMDTSTLGMIRYYVTQAIRRWEPRVDLKDVRVKVAPKQDGVLLINIDYVVRATLDKRTLVYPFYSIPEEH
jgi:phage baseplate assembly protein W